MARTERGSVISKTQINFNWFFWTVIVLVHVAFFLVFYYSNNIYMSDSKEYLRQAYNIKNHLTLYCADLTKQINPAFYSRRTPLYGLLILISKTLYNSNYFVLVIQNIFSLLNIFGLIRLLKEFKFDFDIRKILLVFLVLFPAQYIYSNIVMSEILLQTLIFWSLYNLYYYIKQKKQRNILYFNILLGLAVLTKPVLIYFWVPNLLFMIYLFIKNKRWTTIVYGFIQPLVILLLTLYNYNTTGSFQYSSNKQVSYLDYSATFLLITVRGEEVGWKKWEEAHSYLDTISNYSFLVKESERIATEIILANKTEYLKLHLKGMLNYFFDPGRYDLNYLLSIKESNHTGLMYAFAKGGYGEIFAFIGRQPAFVVVYIALMMIINLLLFCSLFLFLFNRRIYFEMKIFIVTMILYMSFVSGILGTMRYKIHIYFLMLFCLPFAYDLIREKFFKHKTTANKTVLDK
jgi:4-amino-4-deoxy-L-arabinose transferase-like glycosyltransferase